jgi:hypothetical protein
MMDTIFSAQSFVEANIKGQRVELAFANETGERAVVSLPLIIAVAMGPVLTKLETDSQVPPDMRHAEHLSNWALGRSVDLNSVILLLNDRIPLAVHLEQVPELVAGIRVEAEALQNAAPSVRQ